MATDTSLKSAYRRGWSLIQDARAQFAQLKSRTLEDVLAEYLKLLVASGLLAAIVSLAVAFAKAIYYDLFRDVTIQYARLLNYSLSIAAGVFFFYLLAGTFLLGFLTLLLRTLYRNVSYPLLVRVACLSLFPTLLFGWLDQRLALAFLLWSAVLFVTGMRTIQGVGAATAKAARATAPKKARARR